MKLEEATTATMYAFFAHHIFAFVMYQTLTIHAIMLPCACITALVARAWPAASPVSSEHPL